MQQPEHALALPKGHEINNYIIDSVLGQGGFAVVYKAKHQFLDETVVIKEFLPVELAGRVGVTVVPHNTSRQDLYSDCLRRFMDEGRTLVRLRHPHVVRCRDLFTANGTAYLVMDYEDGLALDTLIRSIESKGQRYTEQQLLHFLIPLAEGLAYIHQQGVLHRDIKPGNVFIRRHDGTPVIIDFGAAKQNFAVASQSQAPFTEFYAPLEQIEGGGEAKPTIDIHAFGGLMYRLVCGQVGPKAEARAMALVYGNADPLTAASSLAVGHYSPALLALIDQCLAFRASERPASMDQVVAQLQAIAGRNPSATPMSIPEARSASPVPTHNSSHTAGHTTAVVFNRKALYASIAALLLVILSMGGWQWYQQQAAQRLAAQQEAQRLEQQRLEQERLQAEQQERDRIAQQEAEEQAKRDEDNAWRTAQNGDSEQSYQRYLDQYPNGRYRQQAERARDDAKLAAAQKAREEAAERERQRQIELARQEAARKAQRALELGGEMITLSGGTFTMGCSASSGCAADELPRKQVTIGSFRIGRYELTRGRWAAFVRATNYVTEAEKGGGNQNGCYTGVPDRDPYWGYSDGLTWRNASFHGATQSDNHPVTCVSHTDAEAFIAWLNKETGMKFRLPTEAEWEYAARGGSSSMYGFGNNENAACSVGNVADTTELLNGWKWVADFINCSDNYSYTAPVGSYQNNGYGIYDMVGNVREWVADCWSSDLSLVPSNGKPYLGGDCIQRIERGTNHASHKSDLMISKRRQSGHKFRSVSLGFRLAQDL